MRNTFLTQWSSASLRGLNPKAAVNTIPLGDHVRCRWRFVDHVQLNTRAVNLQALQAAHKSFLQAESRWKAGLTLNSSVQTRPCKQNLEPLRTALIFCLKSPFLE